MRYEFVGPKTVYVGKTLWEIVGNLKNFGVGRLVTKSNLVLSPEVCFLKIIKVQPIPPKKKEFEDRSVYVWVDEIYKGQKTGIKLVKDSDISKFQLIPKIEEEKYLKAAEVEAPPLYLQKFCTWPPLYKKLWEKRNQGSQIPKMKRLIKENKGINIIQTEEVIKPSKCSLYKGELSVHEMYLEIVRLKQLIKSHEGA